MNVASKELCEELYELSGWDDTDHEWNANFRGSWDIRPNSELSDQHRHELDGQLFAAYDLGYLLRKLPMKNRENVFTRTTIGQTIPGGFAAYWECDDGEYYIKKATTPEDAACKLSIELFKQGVLTKED